MKRATAKKDLERELDLHREEVAMQIEELRRANAEITAAKERYAQLFDVAPIGYFKLDAKGMVAEANLTGAELLGLPRDSLLGACFAHFIAPAQRDTFRAMHRRVVEAGARTSVDLVIATEGRRFAARIEASRLGGGECILGVTDETERRRVDEERRDLDAHLAETRRSESLGVLAGGIAHDFEDLTSVVLMHADFALALVGDHAARVDLEKVRSAASKAAELASQMLSYAGRGQPRRELIDVNAVVRSVEPLLIAALPDTIVLHLHFAAQLPPIWADSKQLQQIALNLVVNASEAIGSRRGRISVRTTSPSAASVVLEVVDDGCGMPETTKERACDPFFSTKPTGRGLGLTVVHGAVRAHDGALAITSRVGHGTTIRIELPASRAR
jgi:two-component system cell cycle sensor histidine kinase/response regulator CckA